MKVYGPYTRKDGRKHVCLVHPDGRKQTQSYPRFLMENHLQRKLLPEETVDHVDEDKTNDNLSNFQLLSLVDNAQKAMEKHPRKMHSFLCPVCGSPAEKFLNHVEGNWKKGRSGPYCSRRCAGKASIDKRE